MGKSVGKNRFLLQRNSLTTIISVRWTIANGKKVVRRSWRQRWLQAKILHSNQLSKSVKSKRRKTWNRIKKSIDSLAHCSAEYVKSLPWRSNFFGTPNSITIIFTPTKNPEKGKGMQRRQHTEGIASHQVWLVLMDFHFKVICSTFLSNSIEGFDDDAHTRGISAYARYISNPNKIYYICALGHCRWCTLRVNHTVMGLQL